MTTKQVPSTAGEASPPFDPVPHLTKEFGLSAAQVARVIALLDEGATVPFIARYRKEATGGLDEVQIRALGERREYLSELEARRSAVGAEIAKQGKLTPELAQKLAAATSKAELEDLYLPFKPKRRTRAAIALERGLGPLAEAMWARGEQNPELAARSFVSAEREVPDVPAALAHARDICAERLAEDPELRKRVREALMREGTIRTAKKKAHRDAVTKFDTYASFEERIATLPSHRYLAIRRGEQEEILTVALALPEEIPLALARARVPVRPKSPWRAEMERMVGDAVERLLLPSVSSDVRVELKLRSDQAAIEVFAANLRELLLGAPFGAQAVLGIDPGQRTGCKCAVVDQTGRLLEHTTIYLVQGERALAEAKRVIRELLRKHPVRAVAVGNGTHGRETEAFVRELLREEGHQTQIVCVPVNEAGASVYSASELAREEFPELDLTVRGAVSIARRLQDPLAELVKIDPKSIGVGQYQHDVTQSLLERKLDEVVESCVNNVGVELNLASAPLLSRVAGIGGALAKRLVAHRDAHGPFRTRRALLDVSGLGPRTFEQAAGFLRIQAGEHPLDRSAVHPERYALVERMAKDLGVPLVSLIGNRELLARIELARYAADDVGEFTLRDILAELDKPGRDPRSGFEPPKFRDDVRTLDDLAPGMELEGVVTNITAFGAFVDVGVHQDGLVHISQLADRFVKDPHEVVKVGQRISVRVLEVDKARQRIGLSARRGAAPSPHGPGAQQAQGSSSPSPKRPEQRTKTAGTFSNNPFAQKLKNRG